MLTDTEAQWFWDLFKDTPLFVRWPEARRQIGGLVDPVRLPVNREVFRPGDAPISLFFVARGTVEETFLRDGRPWLVRQFSAGQYFGQEALFTEEYRSRAVAGSDAEIYRMSASSLRVAMERNQELYEELLHERRAGRLRRIPLLRDLADPQIRALAHVIEEHDLAAGTELTSGQGSFGLWIVDLGQVKVTGSANPRPGEWPEWGLTAGNFFIIPGPPLRFGANCVAQRIRARLSTHLFYLPAAHADSLIAAFPEIGRVIQKPLDIVAELPQGDPFDRLSDRQRQHLAQFCGWEFVPKDQTVTTQGSVGHSFVVVLAGAAVVLATDERGRPRPRNFLVAGDAYGTTSLLEGKPRDATVRAVQAADREGRAGLRGVEIVTLDRRDLQFAFAEDRDLWQPGVPLLDRMSAVKEEKRPFEWMVEGETLRWVSRPHRLFLWLPELGIAVVGLLFWLLFLVAPAAVQRVLTVFSLVCVLPLWAAATIVTYINYQDDYYAITNRRVTRRDRQVLLFYEARVESPIDMVQDATQRSGFWGRFFGYGNVTISTAAKTKPMVFSHVPNPRQVQTYIMEGRTEALVAGRGHQQEMFRRELISGLRLVLPIPERANALGEGIRYQAARGRPGCLGGLGGLLPIQWQEKLGGVLTVSVEVTPGGFVWRKHWIKLFQRELWPGLILLLLIVLAILDLRVGLSPFFNLEMEVLSLIWLVSLMIAIVVVIYQYFDWWFDQYIVTDELLIDIEKTPLWLSEDTKQTSLDRIQTVDAKQEGFWRIVLNYGDVLIRTAAAEEVFDFLYVPNPKFVQEVITRKRDESRFRQEQQRARARKQELIESLEVYHQIQQGR